MGDDELDGLLAEQAVYYRARAGEYDATYPLDERADGGARDELAAALEGLSPYGRVLELACGTGQWTAELARHAGAVTAVDSSPEALAICRRRVDASHVLVTALEHPARDQPAPAVRRRLTTGHEYRVVKVLYETDELRAHLAALGWDAEIHTVGRRFFWATVRRVEDS